ACGRCGGAATRSSSNNGDADHHSAATSYHRAEGTSCLPRGDSICAQKSSEEETPMIRVVLRAMAAAVALALGTLPAPAQTDYPHRTITLIVPFAAGGPTDIVARIAGEHMSRTLGQQVVIENVLGAGGTTASARAMRATPDGYTIIMATWARTPRRSRSTRTWPIGRTW